jgi:hypothetical protein
MTEYDYSILQSLLNSICYTHSIFTPWLPLDATNCNAVRGIEPATGPPDSELAAMADLQIICTSDSLLDLLRKLYQYYAGTAISSSRTIMAS